MTKVYLLNVPLNSDYQHTLAFRTLNDQVNYFGSKIVKEYTDFTFQRKDHFIRVPEYIDDLYNCNYVMYQNKNKWFFAFIKEMKYVQEDRTDIYIETDVLQTWMFDISVGTSFIEREHVSDDSIGLHTVPENVQLGEYIINAVTKDENLLPETNEQNVPEYVIMGSTVAPLGSHDNVVGGIYNGIYSGVRYYAIPVHNKYVDGNDDGDYEDSEDYVDYGISEILQNIADEGSDKINGVSSLFLAPKFLIETPSNPNELNKYNIVNSKTAANYTFTVSKKYGLDGYTPKNNKLKTYPYCYLLASNGNGSVAEYHYEFFEENLDCDFVVFGALTPGCSIRMVPAIYKGVQMPESEGLNLGKYPQCNWATDQYTNWLTQNGVNVASSVVNAGVSMGAGFIAGGVPGVVVGGAHGITQIANSLYEVYKASKMPPQTQGNINCGDVVTSMGNNTFTYYNMSIRKEYAQIIDNYFSMYGYKINRLKTPNKFHRNNWWFTKTIDANIQGGIPKDDLNKIVDIYNAGVTFWCKPANFRNYSVDNSIV